MAIETLSRQSDEIDARRGKVADLWIRGFSPGRIARMLKVAESTVRRDVTLIRANLHLGNIATFGEKLTRSVETYRTVQQEAWSLYARADDRSVNKAAALNIVQQAQEHIDRLEGITAPEQVHASALAELYDVLMQAVTEAGGPGLQVDIMRRLQARVSRPGLVTPGETIEADAGEEGEWVQDDESE